MSILRRIDKNLIRLGIAALSTCLIFLDKFLPNFNKLILILIIFGLILSLNILEDYVTRLQAHPTFVLRKILNSAQRETLEITTIQKFLTAAAEARLTRGDSVHILTNSLESYDLNEYYIDNALADNLKEGVKYYYYLPKDNRDRLIEEKTLLVNILVKKGIDPTVLQDTLIFYLVDDGCMYNFATIHSKSQKQTLKGYWYLTMPSPDKAGDVNLVVLALRKDHSDELDKLLTTLRLMGRKVPTF
jgi:hypothetical protein